MSRARAKAKAKAANDAALIEALRPGGARWKTYSLDKWKDNAGSWAVLSQDKRGRALRCYVSAAERTPEAHEQRRLELYDVPLASNRAPAREPLAAFGIDRLHDASVPEAYKKAQIHHVRVYYESIGGEVLAFDAGPFTPRYAETLRDEWRSNRFALVLNAIVWAPVQLDAKGRRKSVVYANGDPDDGSVIRVVTLPSQQLSQAEGTQGCVPSS